MNLDHQVHPGRSSALPGPPVVFVVDGDASVRHRLALLIRSAGWQPASFSSAEEFLARPRVLVPSCLVVEVELPGLSGLRLQQHLTDRPEMPVIFMSGLVDVRATVQAMKAGAIEFLMKPFLGDVLLHTIRRAIEGSQAAIRELTRMHTIQERYGSLSRREREVMGLVLTGRLNKQVGGDLGISEITVKAHRGRMMRKMQAASFAELMNMATALRRSADTDVSRAFA